MWCINPGLPRRSRTVLPVLAGALAAGASGCFPRSTLQGTGAPPRPASGTAAPAPRTARVEAWLEHGDGVRNRTSRLTLDGARFRLEDYWKPGAGAPTVVFLYDGTHPHLVWAYDPARRFATPTGDAGFRALSEVAARIGKEAAFRNYGVPPRFGLQEISGPPLPPNHLSLACDVDLTRMSASGSERVAGIECRRYTRHLPGRSKPPRRPSPGGGQGTVEAAGASQLDLWIDPVHQLVLRREERTEFGETSPIPPLRAVLRVTRIRFPDRLPISTFQPPPRTTVHVPDIFREAALPPGLTIKPLKPNCAGIGVCFE